MRLCCLWLIVIGLLGCDKEVKTNATSESSTLINDWYPIKKGYWIEYSVDSTTYFKEFADTAVKIKQSTSLYREEIIDSLLDVDTPYQYKILAQTKKTFTDPWDFHRYYTVIPYSGFTLKNENNLKFVKLQLPFGANLTWKGNRYIDGSSSSIYQDWNYRYDGIYAPYSRSGISFDSTITVVQIADSNAIEKKYAIEIYAKHVGLIYSEIAILTKQNGANPWSKPENGFVVRKRILNWKK
jgi:hypothetical protein